MQSLVFKKGFLFSGEHSFYFHGLLFDSIYLLILVVALYWYSFLVACSWKYILCIHLYVIAFVFLGFPQVLWLGLKLYNLLVRNEHF